MPQVRPPRFQRFRSLLHRWRSLFGRTATWTVVLVLGLVFLNWPFIDTAHSWKDQELYHFYFISWGILILLLVFIGLCSPGSSPEKDDEAER